MYIFYIYLCFICYKKESWFDVLIPKFRSGEMCIFLNSKDSKSIYCKNNHENIINRDITTKYYLYLLYFTLDDFYLKFGLLLLHIIYEKKA